MEVEVGYARNGLAAVAPYTVGGPVFSRTSVVVYFSGHQPRVEKEAIAVRLPR